MTTKTDWMDRKRNVIALGAVALFIGLLFGVPAMAGKGGVPADMDSIAAQIDDVDSDLSDLRNYTEATDAEMSGMMADLQSGQDKNFQEIASKLDAQTTAAQDSYEDLTAALAATETNLKNKMQGLHDVSQTMAWQRYFVLSGKLDAMKKQSDLIYDDIRELDAKLDVVITLILRSEDKIDIVNQKLDVLEVTALATEWTADPGEGTPGGDGDSVPGDEHAKLVVRVSHLGVPVTNADFVISNPVRPMKMVGGQWDAGCPVENPFGSNLDRGADPDGNFVFYLYPSACGSDWEYWVAGDYILGIEVHADGMSGVALAEFRVT